MVYLKVKLELSNYNCENHDRNFNSFSLNLSNCCKESFNQTFSKFFRNRKQKKKNAKKLDFFFLSNHNVEISCQLLQAIKPFPNIIETGNGILSENRIFSVKLQRRNFLSNLDKRLSRKHSALKIKSFERLSLN